MTRQNVLTLVFVSMVIVLFLTSCTQVPVVVPKEVKVPVVQKCEFPKIDPPRLYVDEVDPEDERAAIKGTRAMEAEIKEREAHRLKLEAAIKGCAAAPTAPSSP